jgi:hypothetical protein
MPKGVYPRESINKRFWSKVDKKESDECWNWKGCTKPKGYGKIVNGKEKFSAHRFSWMIHNGDPGNLWILHKCDNPSCVNPNHLFLGTPIENTQDMISKNRKPLGEKHNSSKLTNQDIYDIRKSNLTQTKLAEIYGVDQTQISNIKNRKQWKHI